MNVRLWGGVVIMTLGCGGRVTLGDEPSGSGASGASGEGAGGSGASSGAAGPGASGSGAGTSTGGAGATGGAGGCTPAPEVCNGLDDDCNGFIDETDPGLGVPCDTGLPGPCAAGTVSCERGALVCKALAGVPETCNGEDDDCDGVVDGGNPGGGAPCDTGMPGACAAGTVECLGGALTCQGVAGPTTEVCNDLDDDCNGQVDETPSLCTRRVFVTSQGFLGDLGGLDGADAKCQALADAAALTGTYKAWLSSSTVDARDRLTHVGKPYVLVDGTLVADDWDDLVDGYLHHRIDLTEQLGAPPLFPYPSGLNGPDVVVMTTTMVDGTYHEGGEPPPCADWTQSWGTARYGWADFDWPAWTQALSGPHCDKPLPLYCFEQ